MLAALSVELKVDLKPRRLTLPGGAYCDVDGVSADEMVLVEAFARQGKLLSGQRGKIARDALKLITLAHHRPGAQTIIALADQTVVDELTATSWLAEALHTFDVKVVLVDIDADARDKVAAAQVHQVIKNVDADAN
jgi:hypothetical protein